VVALTGHRIGAVLASTANAYDPVADTFTVLREHMKMRDSLHAGDVVIGPLHPALRAVLQTAQNRAQAVGSKFLFPNAGAKAAVLNESVIKNLHRLTSDGEKFTPHSRRSELMTWALNNGFPRETAQAALDHARGTSSDQAYDRSSLQPQVAVMLSAWADALLGGRGL
jgi:integrase